MGRTALALITFGFAIAKFFAYIRAERGETATLLTPRAVGLIMIVIGLVGLILAMASTTSSQRLA